MTARRLPRAAALLAGASLVSVLLGSVASAQAPDNGRVQRLEQQVRELRAIVFQGRDTGQPVVVKPAGPDPAVTALSQRIDEQSEQIRRLTGEVETMQHDLDEARRTAEQLRADDATRRQAVDDRLTRLEAAAQAASAPAAAAPPAGAALSGPPLSGPTARAYANDTSQFGAGAGGPAASPTAAPPAATPPADAFQAAYRALTSADYPAAQTGFEGWISANPSSPRVPEARYYVGQSLYMREDYASAARSYAQALSGWPKAKWAPEATVKLAESLNQLGRQGQACAALSEFDRRYAREAPAATRTRARTTRTAAKCGAA